MKYQRKHDHEITMKEKQALAAAEQLLNSLLELVRMKMDNGAPEQPGHLMLNREAVTAFERPRLVAPAHLLHRVILMRAVNSAAKEEGDPGVFAVLHRLLKEEDFEYLSERGVSRASVDQLRRERRTCYWRLSGMFVAYAYQKHLEMLDCSAHEGDWRQAQSIPSGLATVGACALRLWLAGALSYVHAPRRWTARLIDAAVAPFAPQPLPIE
jgi:hypothetical protein